MVSIEAQVYSNCSTLVFASLKSQSIYVNSKTQKPLPQLVCAQIVRIISNCDQIITTPTPTHTYRTMRDQANALLIDKVDQIDGWAPGADTCGSCEESARQDGDRLMISPAGLE